MQNVTVRDDLRVISGTGNDSFFVEDISVGDDARISLGSGNDTLVTGDSVIVGDRLRVSDGSGSDTLISTGFTAGRTSISSFEAKSETLTDDQIEAAAGGVINNLGTLEQVRELIDLFDQEVTPPTAQDIAEADGDGFGSFLVNPFELGPISNSVVTGAEFNISGNAEAADGILFTTTADGDLVIIGADPSGLGGMPAGVEYTLRSVAFAVPFMGDTFVIVDPTQDPLAFDATGSGFTVDDLPAGQYILSIVSGAPQDFAFTLNVQPLEGGDEDVVDPPTGDPNTVETGDSFGNIVQSPLDLGDIGDTNVDGAEFSLISGSVDANAGDTTDGVLFDINATLDFEFLPVGPNGVDGANNGEVNLALRRVLQILPNGFIQTENTPLDMNNDDSGLIVSDLDAGTYIVSITRVNAHFGMARESGGLALLCLVC